MKPKAGLGDFYMGNTTKNEEKTHKRGHFNHQQSSKTRDVIRSRSRNRCSIYKCKRRSCPKDNIGGIGAQTAPTPMETDNTTATGYSNGTIKQKRTKAMDMRFYWIKDMVKQGQFKIYWGPGFQSLVDYFTKHHSLAHHKRIRNVYIHADERPINRQGIQDSVLRGCANTSRKAGAQIPQLPLGDNSPPGEIMQYVCNITRFTRLSITSHSQPLINAKYKFQVTNYLQTIL
jgi:hypothetical protein